MSKKKIVKKAAKKDDKPMFTAHIPDSVAKQGETADAAFEANTESPIIDNPSETDVDPVVPDPVVPDPKEIDPTSPDQSPNPIVADGDTDWEHKFNVLKGKYESESKALIEENKNLMDLSENQGQVLAAQAQAAIQAKTAQQAVQVTAKAVAPDVEALDVKEFTSYGDEIEALATRVNMLTDLISGIIETGGAGKDIDPTRFDRLEHAVQMTAEEKYFKELDDAVPNWREIDNSAAWKNWLNSPDDVSMYRHGDMLRNAAENYRHLQVIAIFKKFSAETNADLGVAPVKEVAPVATVGNSNIVDETKVDPLAGQAMPDQTVAGGEIKEKAEFPTKEEYQAAVKDYTTKKITLEEFNDVANRYQIGLAAAVKAQK